MWVGMDRRVSGPVIGHMRVGTGNTCDSCVSGKPLQDLGIWVGHLKIFFEFCSNVLKRTTVTYAWPALVPAPP